MTTHELRVAVIIASVRDGRLAPLVADWFLDHASSAFDLDVIDLDGIDLPLTLPAYGAEPSERAKAALAELSPQLERAEAFVVISPEYNRSFPAPLKNLIDWHLAEWQAKPVAFVSYGGSLSGGVRAIEQLRGVFTELHAVTLRDSVSIPAVYAAFDDEGKLREPEQMDTLAKGMLDQLAWWGLSLRDARAARPFQPSA